MSVYAMTGLSAGIAGQLLLPATDPAGFRPFCLVAIILAFALVPIALTQAGAPSQERAGSSWLGLSAGLRTASTDALSSSPRRSRPPQPCSRLSRLYRTSILYLCAAILGGTIVPTYSVVMAYVNDAVGEDEFVAASGGLLIVQGVGATAGPLLGGLAMSAWNHGLAYTLIAAQILLAVFGVYRSTRRAAPLQMHKGSFVVEPLIPVGTTLESRAAQRGKISR